MVIQISTRIKAVIVTVVAFITFLLTQANFFGFVGNLGELQGKVVESLIIAIVVYIGTLWVVSFRLDRTRFFIVPLFPALFSFLFTLFVELALYRGILGLTAASITFISNIVFILLVYGSILNMNILNLSVYDILPLARAAKTAQYIFSLILNYLFLTVIYNIDISNIYRLALTLLFFIYLSFQLLWVLSLSSKANIKLTIPIALVLFTLSLSLNLWPTLSEMIALLLTIVFYVIFGVALETSPKFSKAVIFEYTFVTLLILFFIFLITDWGINGRIVG